MNPIPDPRHADDLFLRIFAGGRFEPALEDAFQEDLAESKRRSAREIALLGMLIFSLYMVLDPWGAPTSTASVLAIRLLGVMPGLAWLAWAADQPFFLRRYRPIIYGVALSAGMSIVAIILVSTPADPAYYAYYSGVILVSLAVPTWTYLRVFETAMLNMATTLACLGVTAWQYATHPPLVPSNPSLEWGLLATAAVMLVSCNVMCVLVARNRERHLRSLFIARRSLEAEKLRAEELARVKDAFLARMSHEIRTPLNAVLGYAQIGLRESGDASEHQHFQQIRQSGAHLLGIIDDILDFSRLETGTLALDEQRFELAPMIDSLRAGFADQARARSVTLHVHASPDLPASCIGDRARIRQVLANVMSNAVKFTEGGDVRLVARREADRLMFVVTDSGIGMDAAALARLSEPFSHADVGAHHHGGNGLGMAISKRLLARMGGELQAESRLGTGTRITVRLALKSPEGLARLSAESTAGAPSEAARSAPAARELGAREHAPQVPARHASPRGSAPARRLAGVSVLAAEDNMVNRRLLEAVLRREGAQVEFGANGREALDLLERHGCDRYQLVLTDIQMPVMDGYELTREVLARCRSLPVIGLTAFAMTEARERCLATGMVEHLSKPIDIDTLVAAVLRHASPPPRAGGGGDDTCPG